MAKLENDNEQPIEVVKYEEEYSEESFWSKLGYHALTIGRNLVDLALQLYYAMQDPDIPTWVKTVIMGALGYLILPLDAIPDLIPGAGYTDDLGAIVAAVGIAATYITPEVKAKAGAKLKEWFG